MMNNIPIILSFLPFLLFIYLLIIRKSSLLSSSAITLLLYTLLTLFYWKIYPNFLYISYGKGFFVALDIFFIIFGAIFFIGILRDLKIINNISYYLEHFSKDYRIQIIVIAWLFSAFLEGTAGFGIPAAITVPLLIGLGLTPIRALIVGLIGNSTPGIFGAVGTPIGVGLAGLNVGSVPVIASLINTIGFIVPVFMLWIITKDRLNKKNEFIDALPFAIWSGIAFVIPSFVIANFWPEFPTILGSLIALVLVFITTKLNIFVPKVLVTLKSKEELVKTMSPFRAFLPYIILIIFLILGKVFLGKIGIPINLGFKHVFNIFNPGFAFIVAGFLVLLIWKSSIKVFNNSLKEALLGVLGPFFVIISMLTIVQLMINSGNNTSGISGAIVIISKFFETPILPFYAPFIGAFGAFITGSVTVSNIMFGNLFYSAATALSLNPQVVLSLGLVGAGAGNMIALADILTAEAVAGVKNKEREILKGVFIPCIIYIILTGLIGLIFF